jgi:phenylalanine-4-hydroxylase
MELKEQYLKGGTIYHEVVGHVTIVNDSKLFAKYKKLGLDVFKAKEKKIKKSED